MVPGALVCVFGVLLVPGASVHVFWVLVVAGAPVCSFFFFDAGELLLVFLDAGGSWSSCCVFIGSWWFLELLLVFFGSWWFLELLLVFGTVQSAGENANSCG